MVRFAGRKSEAANAVTGIVKHIKITMNGSLLQLKSDYYNKDKRLWADAGRDYIGCNL